ncbi:golgin subfamily A member 6-like protein 6 isoform X2 [Orbicella faveolata]|uniref:golgin subfamily A member 6-like protein 6 isoform X2 n=1 Tax=Orbicella faveolata TaxID=48498 RepID=UPI0009E558BF|nr:golgin subfamily A member 6-like protein 6 isoform X2 [Orbicella faveolata]
MALNKGSSEGVATREDLQVNFAKSFVDLLKQHRAVLPTLPEMLERLIPNETSETQNFDMSREDEQRVLTKRKKADLFRHYKSLQGEMAEKDERIKELEKTIQEKNAQIEAMKEITSKQERLFKDKEEEITRCRNYYTTLEKLKSSDEYIKEAEVSQEKIGELTDRITSLESELKSKDQEMALIEAK